MSKQIVITTSLEAKAEFGMAGTAKNGTAWIEVDAGKHEIGDEVVCVIETTVVPEGMSPRQALRSDGCKKREEKLIGRVAGFGKEYVREDGVMHRAYIELV